MKRLLPFLPLLVFPAQAELRVSSLFTDHMVVQRDQPIRVWGWDDPGHKVKATFDGKSATATAGKEDGRWELTLPAHAVSCDPLELKLSGSTEKAIGGVLVGEVWVCSGQSNMRMTVGRALDADLEMVAENHPLIHLLKLPNVASQEPLDDFKGEWRVADSPAPVSDFSAVGYYFGKVLAETLRVPVGLIDNSWGGSAAESWIRRDVFEADARNQEQIDKWKQFEANLDQERAKHVEALAKWKARKAAAKEAGKPFNQRQPRGPEGMLKGNQRPGNLFGGMLHPLIGYGIRGAIWYQGESNSTRPENYRSLFPSMISHWRDVWGQGDFPFYWVQLADFKDVTVEPPADSSWARLRDAQTETLSLPHTGQAVIIDVGEAHDIHPVDKLTVGKRLARHALNKDYGFTDLSCESPRYKSHEVKDGGIVVTFDTFGAKLDSSDFRQVHGFAIAGADMQWKWAGAKREGDDKVVVSHPEVKEPKHVRYGWADNPVNNLQNQFGLPATPFRSDR